MVQTNNLADFVSKNDPDMKRLTTQICQSLQYPGSVCDIVQDVYVKMKIYGIIESYDPHFHGEQFISKLSTFVYRIIRNHVISCLKAPENRLVRFQLSDCDPSAELVDEVESIIRNHPIAEEARNIMEHNEDSDSIDGIGTELRDFERQFSKSKDNKRFSLRKRKCKKKDASYNFLDDLKAIMGESPDIEDLRNRINNIERDGCTLLDLFQLLYKGYNNKQIAAIYSISYMSVTLMKQRLAQEMMRYGFGIGS